jgi:hypothetical protein
MGRKRSTKKSRAAAAAKRAYRLDKEAAEAVKPVIGKPPLNEIIVEDTLASNEPDTKAYTRAEIGDPDECINCWNTSKLRTPCCKRPICKKCADALQKNITSCISCGITSPRYDMLIWAGECI